MTEYNRTLCETIHENLERRLGVIEANMQAFAEKQEERVQRIHERFDEVTKELLRRQPAWVTIIIGLLSALCAGLAVAAIR